jgi:hypothetical protein
VALVGGADGRDVLALANVGDSRAYVFSGGQIVQVTADHSLAEERMRHGEMTEEEAAVHPQRHILTRALGVAPDVDIDMWELQLQSGDRVVLCSDGLSNEVGLDELAEVLAAVADPGEAAQRLVEAANDRGGADNITVVVVDVLVGEDGDTASSVVTPIGTRAGAPLVMAAGVAAIAGAAGADTPGGVDALTGIVPATGSATAETAVVSQTDTLAPGARLGFSGQPTEMVRPESPSGEFFRSDSGSVPVARSTVRVPPAPRPMVAAPVGKESRSARRRRLGIPRRITVRVVLFALMVLAVPTGAYFAIRWYAYDNWFLSVQGKQIVIKQGHPGGILWFDPRVVVDKVVTDKTDVGKISGILPAGLAQVRSGVQEPTLIDARNYVINLHLQYLFQHAKTTPPAGTGPNTIGPSGSIPNITAPPTTTTTTTVPGQTTVPVTVATTPPAGNTP